jgi:hypothetical protein
LKQKSAEAYGMYMEYAAEPHDPYGFIMGLKQHRKTLNQYIERKEKFGQLLPRKMKELKLEIENSKQQLQELEELLEKSSAEATK